MKHLKNNWWKYLLALALIAFAIFVWPTPQIRENRAEKAQLAEAVATEPVTEPEPESPPAGESGEGEGQAAPAPAPAAPAGNNSAPADSGETSYEVDGNTVNVFAGGKLIAEVEFLTTVDNMPTEWLNNRPGIGYLYQTGIGNEVSLKIELFENGSFAVDGDVFQVGETTMGIVDNSADVLMFADTPGVYTFSGSSFGIAFGSYRAADDKAGYVLQDRHNAINWDGRPEYWLSADGGVPVPIE